MAHHRIIIETSPYYGGRYRADVADPPSWLSWTWAGAETAKGAYGELRYRLRRRYPHHTFDFIHVHAQETT